MVKVIQTVRKDPDATVDYCLDWGEWLSVGDSLASASWNVPSGLVLESEALDGAKAIVRISGGNAGESYVMTCSIDTTLGQKDDRSICVLVSER